MNREQLKQHIANLRLNLPQGVKFAVCGPSAYVLESAAELECEYLYVAMERDGIAWARQTYGGMETHMEGAWVGNSVLKVFACYVEEQVVTIDGIPCLYVSATNPFQADPMAERPVPKLEDHLILTGKNVDFGDIVGDYLGAESTLATKDLFKAPLKDASYGHPQEWKKSGRAIDQITADVLDDLARCPKVAGALLTNTGRTGFSIVEYRQRLVNLFKDRLGLNGEALHDRERLNSASLKMKVRYARYVKALERVRKNEAGESK